MGLNASERVKVIDEQENRATHFLFAIVTKMLSSGLKSFGGVVRCKNAAFSVLSTNKLRSERVKAVKKELLSIQPAREFLNAVKEKGAGVRFNGVRLTTFQLFTNILLFSLSPTSLLRVICCICSDEAPHPRISTLL